MTAKNFIDNCILNPYQSILYIQNTLNENYANILNWAEANATIVNNVTPSNVSKMLQQISTKLLATGAPAEIVGNTYSEYSVIACILANQSQIISQKSLYNKIGKLFYQILANSNHFTIMYRKSAAKHARTISIVSSMPVEVFWIIPIFLNQQVFNKFDIKDFSKMIDNCTQIAMMVSDFKFGYNGIIKGLSVETSESYKQFIGEAMLEYQKRLLENKR